MSHPLAILVGFLAFVISLTVHEFCHALAGHLLGDDTAKRYGRLTLNPLAHIDPIGTVLIPLFGMFSGLPIIGWAKPVPFNAYNLKYQKWGATIVALAGPVSNFVSAFLYLLLLKFSITTLQLTEANLLVIFLFNLVSINIVLGLFNFIPIPPLDGSKLLEAFLASPKYRTILFFLETRGFLILLVLVFFGMPFLGSVFDAVLAWFFRLAGL